MTENIAAGLISQKLDAIYGYAYARLYDKDQAEDLAGEIVCAMLASAKNCRDDRAFWGYAWKIAENTFRKFIRRKELCQFAAESEESPVGVCEPSAETVYLEREEEAENLYLLRRELSLLNRRYREICVAHYVENKSCSLIAKEQNISVEMVKYHLSRTRKLLKEGIAMTRKLGEKSYNPGVFRMDFWGDRNCFGDLLRRRLPGAILLAAYESPMTAEELSVELGVAMPYLEEELEKLEAVGVLSREGKKYRTALVIITDAYETEFTNQTAGLYHSVAESVFADTLALLPRVRELDFAGRDYDDNRLMWCLLNIAMVNGNHLARKKAPHGEPKKLAPGGKGWVFGYDNDFKHHHFKGVCLKTVNPAGTAWFSAENYRVISPCQVYDHQNFAQKAEVIWSAVLGERADKNNETLPWLIEHGFVTCRDEHLAANFPVFAERVFEELCTILRPVTEQVAACMIDISRRAEELLTPQVPAAVRDQCGDIAKIHHRLDVSAFLMEDLLETGRLQLAAPNTPLCVWGVYRETQK